MMALAKQGTGRRAVALLAALMVFGWVGSALALGSVRTDKGAYEEDDGVWKVRFTIDYGRKPDLPHVPMTFSFKQVMIYKRVLTDEGGDTPQTRKERVPNATPINVPMDVGFADASGKMFKVTKFKIKLRRSNDFEAGEYELKVKTSDGKPVGRPLRIVLNGKNKAIDYRAIKFNAPKPKPKAAAEPEAPSDGGTSNDGGAVEDMGPDLSDIPDVPDDELPDVNQPPPVEPKQGGCGCHVVGRDTDLPGAPGLVLGLMLGAALLTRRRGVQA